MNCDTIDVNSGDTVIDCGVYLGEFSLLAAYKAGKNASIIGIEAGTVILEKLNFNLEKNDKYKKNIIIINNAVWHKNNLILRFNENNELWNSSISKDGNTNVMTKTIDSVIDELNISKVNFIKMDIEGAELNALLGAKNTLLKYKPKLAITIYHKIKGKQSDFLRLPLYLNSLNVGYKFYINSHAPRGVTEIVLYAIAN